MVNAMAEPARILVVDDDSASRALMVQILAEDGHAVIACSDGAEAMEQLDHAPEFDVVVSDIRMVDVDGLEVLDWVRKHAPETPVLLVTAFGNVDGAVDAIRRGAYDYISKPYDVNAIKLVVDRALRHRRLATENRRLKREIREKYALANVVGRSEGMLQVYKTAARVALTDATVLVVGESGTGKELVARAIHASSARAAGPFIAVDCGAIAEGVLESELFGHARGSFTGDIGTRIQGQLLRVLQEGEIRRVGESAPVKVDTRVVAATNKDLGEAVKAGKFREDLFYRLNVVAIRIPPLRERREDIPLLAEHFAARHAGERGASLTTDAREALLLWDWPGNVRELENAVARALALNPGGTILPEDLPEAVRERWRPDRAVSPRPPAMATPPPPVAALPDPLIVDHPTLDELSRRYAERVLRDAGGNKTRAAEALGIDRKTLSRLLREE